MHKDPYQTDSLRALLGKLYNLGWYGGVHDLCTIKIEGGFEHSLNGHAHESWGLIFVVRTKEITNSEGKIILKEAEVKGETLDDAIETLLTLC